MNISKKFISAVCAFVFLTMIFTGIFPYYLHNTSAVSADYPAQLINIATQDNSGNLTADGTKDNTPCTVSALSGELSQQWRFDYSGSDSKGKYYRIVNAYSGRVLTMKGSEAIVYGNENAKNQYWYVGAVSEDVYGNGLYYSILNYSDTGMSLTADSDGVSVKAYSKADSQKWLLNSSGLQGFAGYCKDMDGNIKAGDIGGVLGETVEVSTFDELKKYAESDVPYTIVVTGNISIDSFKQDSSGHYYCPDGRIYLHSDKTIIGSYSAHTLNNVQFCTATGKGTGNNIIIKNFVMKHSEKSNGNDSIVVYFGSGKNLWADHITFEGHSAVNTQGEALPDWDKFLACCYDADFCTVSDCSFGLHEYGVILGYPSDDENSYKNYNNFPRMSLIGNQFKNTLTRAPGLMRYGYFHSLNNYVYNFSMAYTVHTASKIYAENCFYDGGETKGNVICDWNTVTYAGSYAESGSKAVNCKRTTIEGYAQECKWNPSSNYSYVSKSADDAKTYCENYSGAQSDKSKINYITYKSAGVSSAGYTEAPDGSSSLEDDVIEPVSMNIDRYYMIKNVNSGLYMTVNSSNVEQSPADSVMAENTWRLVPAGDNSYYLQSMTRDKTKVLDVTGGKSADGTNIGIYPYKDGSKNQKFSFTKNSDGSYKIRTAVSENKSCVEVINADKTNGANIQEWQNNGESCQNWILEETEYSGEIMDTKAKYMFRNANSGLYMEIKDAKDEDGQNIQQWGADSENLEDWKDWNSWTLKPMNNNEDNDLYYIVSELGEHRYLNINNGNAELKARDSKTNTQLVRFVKNPDRTYNIVTRVSYDKSLKAYTGGLEIANADTKAGANVQNYTLNGNKCQNWELEMLITVTETTTTTKTTTTTTTTTTAKKTTASSETTKTEQKPIVWGDANNDGTVEIADVVASASYVGDSKNNTLKSQGLLNADVHNNGDGVTANDVLAIQQYLAEIITSLPL